MYLYTSSKQVQSNIPYSQGFYLCICTLISFYNICINNKKRQEDEAGFLYVCYLWYSQKGCLEWLVVADRAWDWMLELQLSETGPLTCLFFPITCNNHTLTFHANALRFHMGVCANFCKLVWVCVSVCDYPCCYQQQAAIHSRWNERFSSVTKQFLCFHGAMILSKSHRKQKHWGGGKKKKNQCPTAPTAAVA